MSNFLRKVIVRPLSFVKSFYNITLNNSIHTTTVNSVKLSQVLDAEPTKAKKRIDPAVLALRENRKKKRLEREIRRLEKFGRKFKPIEELEPDRAILKEANIRKRILPERSKLEIDEEYFLKKEWANYINEQHRNQMEQLERAIKSQQEALKELKKDNVSLYSAAIQLDTKLIPYMKDGPVQTPPKNNYEPPEGDYYDTTYLYDRK